MSLKEHGDAIRQASKDVKKRTSWTPIKGLTITAAGLVTLFFVWAEFSQGNYRKAVDRYGGEGTADKIENTTGIPIQDTGKPHPWDWNEKDYPESR
ncbi:hypothetical protein [Fischerella thermalis]|mgnify:CR=1 FL=1|uniref:hypothetical protein n=1 Tax=Fischerella thermalis TaxID=372787 RepID=UPI00307E05CF